jgi:purine-nucleoside phosphorylase
LVYGEYVYNPQLLRKIIRLEFGVESGILSKRLVISPLPLEEVMPGIEGFLDSEGIKFEWLRTGDPILGMAKGNLKLELGGEPYYVLFIGRGAIEATDRAWIIGHDSTVKEVLFVGAAASLKEDLRPGSCNVPLYTLAVLDPSLIYTGLSEGLPVADKSLAHRILEIGRRVGCDVTSSLHASVPFFYMETRRFLEYLSSIGVHTIDMELSYVLRILNSLKKKAVGLVFVEDFPLHGIEYTSEKYENVKELVHMTKKEIILRIILEFLRSK